MTHSEEVKDRIRFSLADRYRIEKGIGSGGMAHFLKRYWPFLLWVAFAPITAEAARNPGFVPGPESVPYPWKAALLTWARLGVEAWVFFLILRSGPRIPLAFALAAVLFILSIVFFVTDMPGYFYVPGRFHLALVAVLGVAWMVDHSRRPGET